jgi:serine/threonine protein kinase
MGEVFLAEDDRLRRRVAVKRLLPQANEDPHATRRLLNEARAAASLDHPNICGIYEVGEDAGAPFIVMPVVEGETLADRLAAGPMSISDAVAIAAQVADALAAAHANGILHRDIKPSNLMINARNHVRVMDFGLAQVAATGEAQTIDTVSRLTEAGTTVGTVAYMAPEQARAERLDARSDLFSLGLVLFEMVTRCRPFERQSMADGLMAVLADEPPSLARLRPEVPEELQRIVTKALRKPRDERYQSAADVLADLRSLQRAIEIGSSQARPGLASAGPSGAPAAASPSRRTWAIGAGVLVITILAGVFYTSQGAAETQSVAVLPLVNHTGNPDDEYVADGVTQSLIRSLSQVPNLKVISRHTAFAFKGKPVDVRRVAEQLAVGAVMTGTVSLADGRRVVDVELTDATDASVILSQRYIEQASSGVGTVESDIARDVAAHLRLTLSGENEQSLARSAAASPEAHHLYLKGRFHANRMTPEALHQSIAYFQQAVERDSGYALAYVGLAQSYVELGLFFDAPHETMPRAREFANRALQVAPDLTDARVLLGLISLVYDWDWEAAARAMTTDDGWVPGAIELFTCAAHLLESTGHGPEADVELRKALLVDPLSAALNAELGCGSYYRRRYDAAIQENLDALEFDPDNLLAFWGLGRAYGQKKDVPGGPRRTREGRSDTRRGAATHRRGDWVRAGRVGTHRRRARVPAAARRARHAHVRRSVSCRRRARRPWRSNEDAGMAGESLRGEVGVSGGARERTQVGRGTVRPVVPALDEARRVLTVPGRCGLAVARELRLKSRFPHTGPCREAPPRSEPRAPAVGRSGTRVSRDGAEGPVQGRSRHRCHYADRAGGPRLPLRVISGRPNGALLRTRPRTGDHGARCGQAPPSGEPRARSR